MKKLAIAVLLLVMTTATFAQKNKKVAATPVFKMDPALVAISNQKIPFTYDQKSGEVNGVTTGYEGSSIRAKDLLNYSNGSTFRGNDIMYAFSSPTKNGDIAIFYRSTNAYYPHWSIAGTAYGPVTFYDVTNSGNDLTVTSPTGVMFVLKAEGRNVHMSVIKPALAAK